VLAAGGAGARRQRVAENEAERERADGVSQRSPSCQIEVATVTQERGEQRAHDGDASGGGDMYHGVGHTGRGSGIVGRHGGQHDVDQDRGDETESDAPDKQAGNEVPGSEVWARSATSPRASGECLH
jgi:hypothetical protein